MKKILVMSLVLWIFVQSCVLAICIEWDWICNDTITSKDIPEDRMIEGLIDLWEIKATKQEVEKYWIEKIKAYYWSFDNWITTQKTVKTANLWWNITRAELAKMMVWFSINVMETEFPTGVVCSFDDIKNINSSLKTAVIQSCELWIMWQWIKNFRPNDFVSRAEFWTVLSRVLRGEKNEWGATYYENHLKALKSQWIMNKIDTPMDKEIRWYVMLMLMRTANEDSLEVTLENDNQIADVIKMLE